MLGMGYAMMGTAVDAAPTRRSMLLARLSFSAARRLADLGLTRILINMTRFQAGCLHEVNEACSHIREAAGCNEWQITSASS